MQSKISALFKSPSHVAKSIKPVSAIGGNDDELTSWEKKEHHIFNTCEQRRLDKKMIVGCLVAEAIKEAFKVISCSSAGSSGGSRKRETNPFSTTLQFGDIIFRREVEKRASSLNESAGLNTKHGGAIFCEDKAVTAVCGIRAIWVISSNRRKHTASQLLDA